MKTSTAAASLHSAGTAAASAIPSASQNGSRPSQLPDHSKDSFQRERSSAKALLGIGMKVVEEGLGKVKSKAVKKSIEAFASRGVEHLGGRALDTATGLGKLGFTSGNAFGLLKAHFEATAKAISEGKAAEALGGIEKTMMKVQSQLKSKDPKVRAQGRKMLRDMHKQAKLDPNYGKALWIWFRATNDAMHRNNSHRVLFDRGNEELSRMYGDLLESNHSVLHYLMPKTLPRPAAVAR